ncbi:MAG: polysaccharide biosynthesis protein [Bacteroidales bacterium]|nr:polysaccharide biosynthesis protein [Candidatus Scybalocola fimicaballi]
MAEMKNLARQTAVYGISNILGKFLNWLLVPLYTYVLTSSAEYGVVTNLYAWTALLLVILTYGLETGFFRFANKEDGDAQTVFGTVLTSVTVTSTIFAILVMLFSNDVAVWLGYPSHPEYVTMMGIIVAIDAVGTIPFAYLRYENKAGKFAIFKLLMILVNIGANLFFLILCPKMKNDWGINLPFYDENYGVGYIFVSNFISTLFVTLLLLPEIRKAKKPDAALLKKILGYSLPLLLLGIAGIMNQTIDKIMFPYLMPDRAVAESELGIYGACFKVAMVMMVFTQAFRYAYEPFVFAQSKGEDKKVQYALAMKYYVIFALLIALGMSLFIDLFALLVSPAYRVGMTVVPLVLLTYLFQGIYFNLSIWYKLTDRTHWGAILSTIGLVITLVVNIALVPEFSYYGSAIASFLCYMVVTIVSYIMSQKYFPIDYDNKSMAIYFVLALGLYAIFHFFAPEGMLLRMLMSTVLLIVYIIILFKRDFPASSLPVVGKYFR